MKRHLYIICTLLFISMWAGAGALAQENAIRFTLMPIDSEEVPQATVSVMNRKLLTALDRSQASSLNRHNVFAIFPKLVITDAAETEGMVREVGRVSAELTLTAMNIIDGTTYHSVTIPLKGSATGGKNAAIKAMANAMKPTDPVYVRFVRVARTRIDDYYAENCGIIIEEARKLVTLRRYAEAASYLSAVPASVSCYDQASVLLEEIMPYLDQTPDTVVTERVIEKVVVQQPTSPIAEPVPATEPETEPETAPEPEQPNGQVTIDGNDLDFVITGCVGDRSRQRIVVTAKVTNRDIHNLRPYMSFNTVITDGGRELDDKNIRELDYRSGNMAMPDGVPVVVHFEITKVKEEYTALSYVELSIRGVKVTIRNLSFSWQ